VEGGGPCLFDMGMYQLRPKVSEGRVSVASRGQEKCISCVRRCLKDVYQLRPKVSEGRVSAASCGQEKFISCVRRGLKDVYQLRPAVTFQV
jgi:hypothetical protein